METLNSSFLATDLLPVLMLINQLTAGGGAEGRGLHCGAQ